MLRPIINIMKSIIKKYELKYGADEKPVFICIHFDARNRYKNKEYKIPETEPQCPIHKDNRCCGGCNLAPDCEHAVDCNCYGYTIARLGGTVQGYKLHKASKYSNGRLKDNGEFDWEYWEEQERG